MRFVDKGDGEGCWIWTGKSVSRNGYPSFGSVSLPRRTVRASRYMFFLTHGRWPTGYVLHSCDNRLCVRPDHLHEGSQSENMKECVARGRHKRGARRGDNHPHARLTAETVLELRTRHRGGERIAALARSIGETYQAVWCAVKGNAWKHLEV